MHVLSCCLAQKIIFSLTLSSSLWLHKLSIVTANNTKCQELFVNQLIYDSFKSISEDYPRPTITCPQNNIGTLLFTSYLRRFREVLPQGKWIRNWKIVVSKKESLFIFQSQYYCRQWMSALLVNEKFCSQDFCFRWQSLMEFAYLVLEGSFLLNG